MQVASHRTHLSCGARDSGSRVPGTLSPALRQRWAGASLNPKSSSFASLRILAEGSRFAHAFWNASKLSSQRSIRDTKIPLALRRGRVTSYSRLHPALQ